MTKEQLQERIIQIKEKINWVKQEVHKKIVWQDNLIEAILIGIFTQWHILIEWVPGLAKTMTVSTLSNIVDLDFKRIQFTPDLLPSDLIWTEIYNPKTWWFDVKKWPIFTNLLLADEINRSPSKVQSALLEAMAEKQVTIWNETFKLEEPFVVLATQNPIEQWWTYQLPEAQLDRFLMKVDIDYSSKDIEKEIYKKINWDFDEVEINNILTKNEIIDIKNIVKEIYVSENIFDYVSNIVDSTRNPDNYWLGNIWKYILYGISPRWWIWLIMSAKVIALFNWRSFVIPEDIKKVALWVLSHRLVLSYEALSDEVSSKDIIEKILSSIEIV